MQDVGMDMQLACKGTGEQPTVLRLHCTHLLGGNGVHGADKLVKGDLARALGLDLGMEPGAGEEVGLWGWAWARARACWAGPGPAGPACGGLGPCAVWVFHVQLTAQRTYIASSMSRLHGYGVIST